LKNPDLVVFVSVFKAVAGMALVQGKDWRKYNRFNIQQMNKVLGSEQNEGA
jgi:tRNA(Ser,Leu) C12 N-acetylase TAN1